MTQAEIADFQKRCTDKLKLCRERADNSMYGVDAHLLEAIWTTNLLLSILIDTSEEQAERLTK